MKVWVGLCFDYFWSRVCVCFDSDFVGLVAFWVWCGFLMLYELGLC